MKGPIRKLRASLVCGAVSCLMIIPGAAWAADKLVSPADGQSVRGVVKFAVAKSDVPEGGFVSIYVDNQFIGASAVQSSGNPPLLVYTWETKSYDESRPSVKDGKHDLKINMHDASGTVADTITSTFILANKASMSSPNEKVKLLYKFASGATSTYRVSITSQSVSEYGRAISGTPPIRGDYRVIQRVEDAQPNGTALLSYAVDRDGVCYILGQPNVINPGRRGSSVYKQMDSYGRVLQDNVLSRKGRPSIPDVLVELPRQPIKIGDSWTSQAGKVLRIEGAGQIFRLGSQNTLEDLEWENDQVCAKIKSTLSGVGRLLSRDKNAAATQIKGEGVFYIALKTGKLVKSVITLSAKVDLDLMASGATSGPGAAPGGTGSGSDIYDEDEDTYRPASASSTPGASPAAQPSGGVRITVVTQL